MTLWYLIGAIGVVLAAFYLHKLNFNADKYEMQSEAI